MSASISPTASPRAASDTARFAVSEDLPTPPLPDAMAYTRVREPGRAKGMSFAGPWSSSRSAARWSSDITSSVTSTPATPGTAPTAVVTRSVIVSRIGQPPTVSRTVTATRLSSVTVTPATMPSSVTGRRISGSSTVARAALTWSRLTVGMRRCYVGAATASRGGGSSQS